MSSPQDEYPFSWPMSYMIATSGKDRESVPKSVPYTSTESLQHDIWTPSVELTSWQRTSLPCTESAAGSKLTLRHLCDRTCHCILHQRDAMPLYASSTSTASNIRIALILPSHPVHWSICLVIRRVASNHRIVYFGATLW